MLKNLFWSKLAREYDEFLQQISGVFAFCTWRFRKYDYDRRDIAQAKITMGECALSERVLIYLAYQPNGLSPSTFEALEAHKQAGLSIFFVSNAPISADELVRLRPYAALIVERLNFGYDFGGYRFAIRYLKSTAARLHTLIIVNDSIWFPIHDPATIFRKSIEVQGFGGSSSMAAGRRNRRNVVLSYWLVFGPRLLDTSVFFEFWNRYVPTNNKYFTVRLGERGLSNYMAARHIPFECAYTPKGLISILNESTPHQILMTLQYAAFVDKGFADTCGNLIEAYTPNMFWKKSAIVFIEEVISKRNFHASFCYASIVLLGVPFIKKNSSELHLRMRRQYLKGVECGHFPTPSERMLAEIKSASRTGIETVQGN